MKKLNYLSLAAIATFGLASCSSDEPYNGSNTDQNADGNQYLAVTIRTAGMSGTRAPELGNPEFEGPADGSNEGSVTKDNIYFFFYDADGNPFQLAAANVNGTVYTNVVKPLEISSTPNTDGEDPSTIQGVLVLGTPAAGYVGTHPTQMLCVANPVATNMDEYTNKPLSQVLNAETSNTGLPALSNFVMTSSTYVDNGKKVVATDVHDKFFNEPDDAKKAPAVIYLERVAAKVRAHGLGDYTPQYRKGNDIVTDYQWKVNNENVDLQVTLDGWRLTNISTNSLAFKNVEDNVNYFEGWNAPTLHRCYWALSKVSTPLANNIASFNIWDKNQWTRGNFNADQPTVNIAYTYENTQYAAGSYGVGGATSATDRMSNATGILVRATVKMKKEGEAEFKAVELTRWAGAYYTEAELKQMIIDNYNVAKKLEGANKLTADKVSFIKDKKDGKEIPNRWRAQIKISENATQDWGDNYNNIMRWIGGATSYYLNVEHLGGLFGVVRNHIYDYTVNGVVGLGVPGNDPENPTPEQETYLAAKVAILNWHVISNNVVLE